MDFNVNGCSAAGILYVKETLIHGIQNCGHRYKVISNKIALRIILSVTLLYTESDHWSWKVLNSSKKKTEKENGFWS